MTQDEARATLLSFEGSFESCHQGHPDFRNKKGIFGSLQPEKDVVVLRLPLEMGEAIGGEDLKSRRVVSRFGGMAWVAFDLESVDSKEFAPLAGLAFESRLR